jgi:hypothetical protein
MANPVKLKGPAVPSTNCNERKRKCLICEKDVVSNKNNAHYCSKDCCSRASYLRKVNAKDLPKPEPRMCPNCGFPFPEGKRINAAYCSPLCTKAAATRRKYWKDIELTRDGKKKQASRLRAVDPELAQRYGRHRQRLNSLRRYGVSEQDIPFQLEKTVCDCCGDPPDEKGPLHIDHCHESGKFRGMICRSCNLAIGQCQESVERLESCKQYIILHKSPKS